MIGMLIEYIFMFFIIFLVAFSPATSYTKLHYGDSSSDPQ